ncbi:hypothetical protein I4F81_003672 [Pyropia yezoensis]|uniref:Uncharacterized protein n=1 Tax=Pyropia yezoensis TaxID=2788 RepID=A0ACC3BU11_PYRYE|nr:hypothetical protein I4F81_003672 [Neopyropia yezoensis]
MKRSSCSGEPGRCLKLFFGILRLRHEVRSQWRPSLSGFRVVGATVRPRTRPRQRDGPPRRRHRRRPSRRHRRRPSRRHRHRHRRHRRHRHHRHRHRHRHRRRRRRHRRRAAAVNLPVEGCHGLEGGMDGDKCAPSCRGHRECRGARRRHPDGMVGEGWGGCSPFGSLPYARATAHAA